MKTDEQVTEFLPMENHIENQESHVETRNNRSSKDGVEYFKSSNVIRLCAVIVAKPKFAFGEL